MNEKNKNEVLFSPLHNCPRDWQNMPIMYLSIAEVRKGQSRYDDRALLTFFIMNAYENGILIFLFQ